MSAAQALQAMTAMQQQIEAMQTRMDAHDRVSGQTNAAVHAINHPAACQPQPRTSMGDSSGLGRPQTFSADEAQFRRWSQDAESLFSGVFPDGARLLVRAAVRTDEISSNKINDEFVVGEDANRVENLTQILHQLHTALEQFTDGEAHDIVIHSRRNPLEAVRRLLGRFDPTTGSRKRNLLTTIIAPDERTLRSNWATEEQCVRVRAEDQGSTG